MGHKAGMIDKQNQESLTLDRASVGLPGAPSAAEDELRDAGIDPDRLAIRWLGTPRALLKSATPLWKSRFSFGILLWLGLLVAEHFELDLPQWAWAGLFLFIGLIILQAACEALISSTERLAARLKWTHYVAGTVTEILATLPELVVIAFLIPISPVTALTVALITLYNNTLVFSLYSYFLPKNQSGKFIMPAPITEVGSQVLIAGAGISLSLGLIMLTFTATGHKKDSFSSADLIVLGIILLLIFSVYVYKLVTRFSKEEEQVQSTLQLSEKESEERLELPYTSVQQSSLIQIGLLFIVGIIGSVIGGELISRFAEIAISDIGLNSLLTALLLAGFAGMSEYVILWKTHRKNEHGIALANAFGGITQVLLLILPFTVISIGLYQLFTGDVHQELPMVFDVSLILLVLFLFPTFFVLLELIAEDHTFDLLDTTIMTSMVAVLILLLVSYGGN